MHDPGGMGVGEAVGNLRAEIEEAFDRQRAAPNFFAQRLPVDQLGDDVGRAVVDIDVEHRHDVWMVQAAGGARFFDQPPHALAVVIGAFVQDLESDVAAQPRIPGAIHLAHGTAPERRRGAAADPRRDTPGPWHRAPSSRGFRTGRTWPYRRGQALGWPSIQRWTGWAASDPFTPSRSGACWV